MVIREANENDNQALLDLTQACPMEGAIKLLIDRVPDFFSLLKTKGDYKVFVAIKDRHIIASFALVTKYSYIQQAGEKIGYLCDMKIAPAYRNSVVAYRLMKTMLRYMRTLPIDFYLCVTAKGNQLVETLLKGRLGIPAAFKAADFNVYQMLPSKRATSSDNIITFDNRFRETTYQLLRNYYQHYNFASFFNDHTDISGNKAWTYQHNGKPVAFISVVNMETFKQNRVIQIPGYLKITMRIAKLLWPKIKIPAEGEAIQILNIQYFAYEPSFYEEAKLLLKTARHYAYINGFTFLSYGVDVRNPLTKQLKSVPGIIFHSVGYVFDFSPKKRWTMNSLIHDNFFQV